jgi:hypothetical protein
MGGEGENPPSTSLAILFFGMFDRFLRIAASSAHTLVAV